MHVYTHSAHTCAMHANTLLHLEDKRVLDSLESYLSLSFLNLKHLLHWNYIDCKDPICFSLRSFCLFITVRQNANVWPFWLKCNKATLWSYTKFSKNNSTCYLYPRTDPRASRIYLSVGTCFCYLCTTLDTNSTHAPSTRTWPRSMVGG